MRIDPSARARRSTGLFLTVGIAAALGLVPAACSPSWYAGHGAESPSQELSEPAPPATPLSERERAVHLLSRSTYGVRPQDVDEVLHAGITAWLDRQLHPARIDDSALDARLDQLEQANQRGSRSMVFSVVTAPSAAAAPPIQGDPQQMAPRPVQTVFVLRGSPDALAAKKLERAIRSERQLEEVMTDFWFNHFNVFATKDRIMSVLDDYERTAIRAHVFGRFEDMLVAVAQHPAMLMYLDNALSTATADPDPPPATAGAPTEPRGGLNENYARELLELHTLGVDGGYSQQDVVETARAFTGWAIRMDPSGSPATPVPVPPGNRVVFRSGGSPMELRSPTIEFEFQAEHHDRGEKTVLGTTLLAGRDMEDGLDVLRMLAQHPSTAEFLARKLVTHFVADDPPPALANELADVFRATGGDLGAVTRALFMAEGFYDPAHARAKAKRPFELVASALRVTGAEIEQSRTLLQQLRTLGHFPYLQAAPTGYPVTRDAWISAGAMLMRVGFALDLAGGRIGGVRLHPVGLTGDALADLSPAAAGNASENEASFAPDDIRIVVRAVLAHVLPAGPLDLEDDLVHALTETSASDVHVLVSGALGTALASPAFQWH